MDGHSAAVFSGKKWWVLLPSQLYYLGVSLKGRAIRYKSAVVPPCGLFPAVPHAVPSPYWVF
jgi:hypothetical protein